MLPQKNQIREGHIGTINSIRCHSLSQIAALLYQERGAVGLARQEQERGGVRTERGGEPGQSATPAYAAGLALQLTDGADAYPGPLRQRLLG
jgi:hypothetical protein